MKNLAVFEAVVTKEITPEDCINILEAHESWSLEFKVGARVYTTKSQHGSNNEASVYIVNNNDSISSLEFPKEFASEHLKITGKSSDKYAERISNMVNMPWSKRYFD